MVGQFILTCSGYTGTISPAIQIYKGDSMKFEISIINKIITSINDISIGQVVKTTLKDGKINLSVVSKEQKNGKEWFIRL